MLNGSFDACCLMFSFDKCYFSQKFYKLKVFLVLKFRHFSLMNVSPIAVVTEALEASMHCPIFAISVYSFMVRLCKKLNKSKNMW